MRLLAVCAVAVATLVLLLVYLLTDRVDLATLAVGVGLVWFLGVWRGWTWSANVGLVGLAAAAALGAWLGMSPTGMLVALIVALIAWDLHRFWLRLGSVDYIIDVSDLQKIHLRQLAIVAGVGLVLGILALNLELNLGLGWVILIGLVVALGLSWIVGFVRQKEKA